MTVYVLDASAAIAWYIPETFAAAARGWQRQLLRGEIRIVVPSLHYWEFGNVLRTFVMRHDLSREDAAEVYALHIDAPLEVHDPERATVLATALEFGSTVYDAVYIALAEALSAPLITAEKKTRGWVVKLGGLARLL